MLFTKTVGQIIALTPVVAVAISLPLKDVGEFFSGALPWDRPVIIPFLAFFYLLILSIYLFFYELLLKKLHLAVSLRLEKRGECAVYQENIDRALSTIRFQYLVTKVYRFLDPGLTRYGYPNENKVLKGLKKTSISRKIVAIFKYLISIPVLVSIALSCISLDVFSLSSLSIDVIQGIILQSLGFRGDLLDLLSKLPLLTTILTLVPMVFFFYFYSQKRYIRKIVDQENSKLLGETALLYKDLKLWIDKNLPDIVDNYKYVIGVQKSIVSMRMEKRVPNYFSLTGKNRFMMKKNNYLQLIDFPEVDHFVQIVNKLLSDDLHRYSRIIARSDYDLWELYQKLLPLKDSEKVHWSFYTRSGVEDYISAMAELQHDINEEVFEREYKHESSILASGIYKNLKLVYSLTHGSDALGNYLYSSRTEKFLVKVLQKEK